MRSHTSRRPQQKVPDRPRLRLVSGIVAAVLWCGAVGGWAQMVSPPEPTPDPTPIPAPTPLPAAEISERAAATRVMLQSGRSRADVSGELDQIAADFERGTQQLETLMEDTERRLAIQGPASVLADTEKDWIRLLARLDRWLVSLKEQASRFDGELRTFEAERALWQLTREGAREGELPPPVLQEIEETVSAIDSAAGEVRTIRDRVLELQARISKTRVTADELLVELREESARRRRVVLGVDSPPLWRAFEVPGVDGSLSQQLTAMWRKNSGSIRAYVAEEKAGLLRHLIFLLALVGLLVVARGKAQLWVQQDRSLERTLGVLERPLAAALIVAILLRDLFHPEAPLAWTDLLGLVLALATLRLFPLLAGATLRPLVYVLALLLFLQIGTELAPDGNLIDRLLLLVTSVAGALTAGWVHRQMTRRPPPIPRGWYRVILVGARLAMVLFVASVAANFVGAVGFASVLAMETLSALFAAVILWISAVVLHAVVRVVMLAGTVRRFGLVRLHADEVRRVLFRLVDGAAVIGWIVLVLEGIGLLAPGASWLRRMLGTELRIGEITVVPGDILLFAFVVWISFKLSQLLRISLDSDVYPRLALPRGVPGAINRLTHYVVLVVGVMIAASAAGIDFSRLTLVVGALGVGIGFGLQNIVNNFVSGLILLFERPIRIGDRVELSSQLSGMVERIGIRASIVRTWQGAEVIVPNANLISSEVINWTLSDDRRRMEIPVGVAYGNAPEVVLELLLGVARAHPEVLGEPEPVALFTGFGDSSLDFELRAWTTGDIVVIPSELRVAINRALAEAGIEIPFPQRDLHLRSVAPGAADRLGPDERST
ncbi:MAG TPA: mechanosensitive ion channel domain-containing protein [Chondromyces sp.]|nr:mechanosensitive ion channel domain-containing protein [Chondromyces sp.]